MHKKIITENEAELIEKLCKLIETISSESIKQKNAFYIGFSGERTFKYTIHLKN